MRLAAVSFFSRSSDEPLEVTPSVLAYINRSGVTRPVVPSIQRVDVGAYNILPTSDDIATGTIAVIDGGPAARPRYYVIAVYEDTNKFAVHAAYDAAGNFGSGTPTVESYRRSDGLAKTPPEVEPVPGYAYLHTLFPTDSDREDNVQFRISGPAGTYPRCTWGSFDSTRATSRSSRALGPPNPFDPFRRLTRR